jgi:hypothetical protein
MLIRGGKPVRHTHTKGGYLFVHTTTADLPPKVGRDEKCARCKKPQKIASMQAESRKSKEQKTQTAVSEIKSQQQKLANENRRIRNGGAGIPKKAR